MFGVNKNGHASLKRIIKTIPARVHQTPPVSVVYALWDGRQRGNWTEKLNDCCQIEKTKRKHEKLSKVSTNDYFPVVPGYS